MAGRSQCVVIDFQYCTGLFGDLDQSFEIQFCDPVSRVADNLDKRISHGIDNTLGVLLLRASFPAEAVDAGDADVEHAPMKFVKVNVTLCI